MKNNNVIKFPVAKVQKKNVFVRATRWFFSLDEESIIDDTLTKEEKFLDKVGDFLNKLQEPADRFFFPEEYDDKKLKK